MLKVLTQPITCWLEKFSTDIQSSTESGMMLLIGDVVFGTGITHSYLLKKHTTEVFILTRFGCAWVLQEDFNGPAFSAVL